MKGADKQPRKENAFFLEGISQSYSLCIHNRLFSQIFMHIIMCVP